MFSFVVLGLLVGFAVGLTGVGGGSLMTPVLILFSGLEPATAVGTDLLYAAGTKTVGTLLHGRQKTVDWSAVGLMAAGSLPAAVLTVLGLHLVGLRPWIEHLIVATIALAMVATGILTLVRDRLVAWVRGRLDIITGGNRSRLLAWRPVIMVAGGAGLGMLVTLSSVGAGALGTTMLLILYPNTRMVRIVGTDIAHAVPLTLVAGLGHLSLGTTDLGLLGWLLVGSLPGIYLGTRLGWRLPDRVLRPALASMLVVVALSMLYKTLGTVI